MHNGPRDVYALGERALAAMGVHAKAIPVLVLHGGKDATVSPANVSETDAQLVVEFLSRVGVPG